MLRLLIRLFPNGCHKICTNFARPSAIGHIPEDSRATQLFRDLIPFSSPSEDSQILRKALKGQHYKPCRIWMSFGGTQLGGGPLPATDTEYWGLGHRKANKIQPLLWGALQFGGGERDTGKQASTKIPIPMLQPGSIKLHCLEIGTQEWTV